MLAIETQLTYLQLEASRLASVRQEFLWYVIWEILPHRSLDFCRVRRSPQGCIGEPSHSHYVDPLWLALPLHGLASNTKGLTARVISWGPVHVMDSLLARTACATRTVSPTLNTPSLVFCPCGAFVARVPRPAIIPASIRASPGINDYC